jgi:hypothetical protein
MAEVQGTQRNIEELAHELFRTFARVEYALKAAGFHCGEGDAKANWNSFAQSVRGVLENDSDIADAVAYMTASPPKKQVVRNGRLEWANPPVDGNKTHELLLCVRRVRNNLFHGGKFNGNWFAPERSAALLLHSLSILRA